MNGTNTVKALQDSGLFAIGVPYNFTDDQLIIRYSEFTGFFPVEIMMLMCGEQPRYLKDIKWTKEVLILDVNHGTSTRSLVETFAKFKETILKKKSENQAVVPERYQHLLERGMTFQTKSEQGQNCFLIKAGDFNGKLPAELLAWMTESNPYYISRVTFDDEVASLSLMPHWSGEGSYYNEQLSEVIRQMKSHFADLKQGENKMSDICNTNLFRGGMEFKQISDHQGVHILIKPSDFDGKLPVELLTWFTGADPYCIETFHFENNPKLLDMLLKPIKDRQIDHVADAQKVIDATLKHFFGVGKEEEKESESKVNVEILLDGAMSIRIQEGGEVAFLIDDFMNYCKGNRYLSFMSCMKSDTGHVVVLEPGNDIKSHVPQYVIPNKRNGADCSAFIARLKGDIATAINDELLPNAPVPHDLRDLFVIKPESRSVPADGWGRPVEFLIKENDWDGRLPQELFESFVRAPSNIWLFGSKAEEGMVVKLREQNDMDQPVSSRGNIVSRGMWTVMTTSIEETFNGLQVPKAVVPKSIQNSTAEQDLSTLIKLLQKYQMVPTDQQVRRIQSDIITQLKLGR